KRRPQAATVPRRSALPVSGRDRPAVRRTGRGFPMADHPLTLRLGASNVYLLRADGGYVAIDAGPDYEGAWESARRQLAGAGLTSDRVRAALVTHAHVDHCALA